MFLFNVYFITLCFFFNIRSGYDLGDSVEFAARIERMLRLGVGVDINAPVSYLKSKYTTHVSPCD